jgi:hypothetical protein
MNLADQFEDLVYLFRQNGSRKPIMEAERELYVMWHGDEENPPDFQRFKRTLKKKRLRGRRELREFERKCEEYDRLGCYRWLNRMLGLSLRSDQQARIGVGALDRREPRSTRSVCSLRRPARPAAD